MDKPCYNLDAWEKLISNQKLGEILVQHKKITIPQLTIALQQQESRQIPLGQILIDTNVITKDELIEVLELQHDINRILIDSFNELKSSDNNANISEESS